MEQYFQKQLTALWRVIYVLVIVIAGLLFYQVAIAPGKTNRYVSDLQYKVDQQALEISNLKDNQKRLYSNDSLLVTNQRKIQEGQRAKSFLSFLAKLAF